MAVPDQPLPATRYLEVGMGCKESFQLGLDGMLQQLPSACPQHFGQRVFDLPWWREGSDLIEVT